MEENNKPENQPVNGGQGGQDQKPVVSVAAISALNAVSSFLGKDRTDAIYNKIVSEAKPADNNQQQPVNKTEQVNGNQGKAPDDKKPEQNQEQNQQAAAGDENKDLNKDGKGQSILEKIGLVKAKPEDKIVIDPSKNEEVKNLIKTKFGVDDMNTFFEKSVPEWRKTAQEFSELKTKHEAVEKIISQLPEELYEAIAAHTKGVDWRTVINSRPAIDFNKEVTDYGTKELLDVYFPGKFSEEALASVSENEAMKIAVELAEKQAKEKFLSDKNKFKDARAAEQDRYEKQKQAYDNSVKSSVSHLKSVLPDMPDLTIQEIESELISGNFRSLFYEKDGTLKKEAAYNLMYAKMGPEIVEALNNKTVTEAVNKERESRLKNLPETPVMGGGQGSGGNGSNKIAEELNVLIPKPKKRFY